MVTSTERYPLGQSCLPLSIQENIDVAGSVATLDHETIIQTSRLLLVVIVSRKSVISIADSRKSVALKEELSTLLPAVAWVSKWLYED